ncbi:unnamed protein product, partial [Iphiclides podalirius]
MMSNIEGVEGAVVARGGGGREGACAGRGGARRGAAGEGAHARGGRPRCHARCLTRRPTPAAAATLAPAILSCHSSTYWLLLRLDKPAVAQPYAVPDLPPEPPSANPELCVCLSCSVLSTGLAGSTSSGRIRGGSGIRRPAHHSARQCCVCQCVTCKWPLRQSPLMLQMSLMLDWFSERPRVHVSSGARRMRAPSFTASHGGHFLVGVDNTNIARISPSLLLRTLVSPQLRVKTSKFSSCILS